MRVMHLVQCGPTTGGTVSHVATQVKHQIDKGLTVGVVAASDGVLADASRAAGADVFIDATLLPQASEAVSTTLADVSGKWKPDIVHAHLMHAAFIGYALSVGLDVPFVYTQHMGASIDPFIRAAKASDWRFPVIAVARFAEVELGTYFGDASRVQCIPNGVDRPAPSGFVIEAGSGPNILFCGRLAPEKGADTAVLAFRTVLRSRPDAVLHIVGTGPDETLLRRLTAGLQIDRQTRFYGSVSEALTADAGADLVIAPSRSDAASLVVLETMASGVPLVATHVGGTPEIVRHEVDGILVAPDDPDGVARAAGVILDSPQRGARFAESALERYRSRYTAEPMVERTRAVYERALSMSMVRPGE